MSRSRRRREPLFAEGCRLIVARYAALSSVEDRRAVITSLQELVRAEADAVNEDGRAKRARLSAAAAAGADEKTEGDSGGQQAALQEAIDTFGLQAWLSRMESRHAPAMAAVRRLLLLDDGRGGPEGRVAGWRQGSWRSRSASLTPSCCPLRALPVQQLHPALLHPPSGQQRDGHGGHPAAAILASAVSARCAGTRRRVRAAGRASETSDWPVQGRPAEQSGRRLD